MKKILLVAMAAIAMMLPLRAQSQVVVDGVANRTVYYQSQNPDTNEMNLAARFEMLARGTMLRDLLPPMASSGPNGLYANLLVNPVSSSFNARLQPCGATCGFQANQALSLYQMGAADSSTIPNYTNCGGCQAGETVSSDNTSIVLQFVQEGNSGQLGPFTAASTSGKCNYYVIEAQLAQADEGGSGSPVGSQISTMFINTQGVQTFYNVSQGRDVYSTYAIGSTTNLNATCSTPSNDPAADSGYFPIAWVSVPQGAGQLVSGDITMDTATQFSAGTFGKVTFGGAFASSGGVTPSVMTTSINVACGAATDGEGFVVNNGSSNNNGGHVLRAGLEGNFQVCGDQLFIFAQNGSTSPCPYPNIPASGSTLNSCAAEISGFDANGNQFNLFPSQEGPFNINLTCPNSGQCTVVSGQPFRCQNNNSTNNNQNIAVTLFSNSFTPNLVVQPEYGATASNGITLNFQQIGGSSFTNQQVTAKVVCF